MSKVRKIGGDGNGFLTGMDSGDQSYLCSSCPIFPLMDLCPVYVSFAAKRGGRLGNRQLKGPECVVKCCKRCELLPCDPFDHI